MSSEEHSESREDEHESVNENLKHLSQSRQSQDRGRAQFPFPALRPNDKAYTAVSSE
jgi:hypothetical protein